LTVYEFETFQRATTPAKTNTARKSQTVNRNDCGFGFSTCDPLVAVNRFGANRLDFIDPPLGMN
jgi:hypothetical protein